MNYDKDWYDSLVKPAFQPQAWVFAPVWIILYVLMGIAFLLVLFDKFEFKNLLAMIMFFVQLQVNLSWPPVFFKEHNLRKSFLLCALLTVLVFITMLIFFWVRKSAGILFVPYFIWCCFATILSFEILELNEW